MGNDHGTAATLTGIGASAALAVTSFFCPPLGLAMAISSTAVGGTTAVIGVATDNEAARDIGLAYLGAGVGSWAGGMGGKNGKKILKKKTKLVSWFISQE
ncbi:11538_t:CDS:2 [Ambispora gerdemannii]|uniref:11538_t:CDS:1 n=1 Tax=Ambispora gerdemannii TaxID=144530 RepID=A0A9N9GTE4_9GLOM|nr:11538_t:CDS:2 [Ambispora gerdemannii]